MQNEDDLRGLAKVTDFMRAISFLFLAIHIYWFCYGWLHEMAGRLILWTGYCPISNVPQDCSRPFFTPNCFASSSSVCPAWAIRG